MVVVVRLDADLVLGFVKRRAELGADSDVDKIPQRKVLHYYSPALLDGLINITATCIILSYSLYTLSPETIALHHTSWLMLTVPFVIYGVFRYLFPVALPSARRRYRQRKRCATRSWRSRCCCGSARHSGC